MIKNLPMNKSLGPGGFIDKVYQKFRDKLTPIFLKLFQKIEDKGTLSSSFYKATTTLITKPKILQKKKITD